MKIDIEKMAHIVAEKAIQELRDNGLFVSIWIPVNEGLPEENKTVMASTEYGVFPEARYTKEYGWEWAYESGADYWRELDDVTAWMPLPKHYKPQKEGSEE
jgi:hypothetical protein